MNQMMHIREIIRRDYRAGSSSVLCPPLWSSGSPARIAALCCLCSFSLKESWQEKLLWPRLLCSLCPLSFGETLPFRRASAPLRHFTTPRAPSGWQPQLPSSHLEQHQDFSFLFYFSLFFFRQTAAWQTCKSAQQEPSPPGSCAASNSGKYSFRTGSWPLHTFV